MGKDDVINRSEAKLIAIESADAALTKHVANLPVIMKPIIYEVAENVVARQQKDFIMLFSRIMGADVTSDDHIREIHKDFFFMRDRRIDYESAARITKETIVRGVVKWTGLGLLAGLFAYLGVKINI